MNRNFGRSNPLLEHFKKLRKHECTDKYFSARKEIEKKIDEAVKIPSNHLYTSWKNINKFIKRKNVELKECYDNYISLDLNKEDKIINFSKRCTNDGKCNSGNTQVRKLPTPKTEKKETCEEERNCEKQAPTARAEKIKSETRPLVRDTITVSSPGPDHKDQRQKDTARQESKNGDVSTKSQLRTAQPAPSVVSEVEVAGQSVNLDSSVSEESQAKTQPLIVAETKENVLVSPPRGHPVETITNRESGRGNSSEVSDSDKNIIPSKLLGDQTQSDNSHDQTNTDGRLNLRINFAGQANDPHNVDTADVSKDVRSHGNTVEKGTTDESANDFVLVDVIPIEQHRVETTTSIKHLSAGCDNADMAYADDEDSSVRTHCNEGTSDQVHHSETLSSKGGDNELFNRDANILDTLKDFFESIPNKERVIKTSAPIGIALLLGLLFKYTPLWRVLTKKNRKKGAVINEELNSVLQEPSIMDDERSIPFSYGAFEYSSFDQNSY